MAQKGFRTPLQKAQDRLGALASSLAEVPPSPKYKFPPFDELPKVPNQPQGCIWGFYDKNGKKDEVGSINILTPEVVTSASREIVTGEHVQLDWPLHNVQFPSFGRKPFEQRVIDFGKDGGLAGMDDELHINTQSGSQWDSLRHFAHQKTRMYYNGVSHKEGVQNITNGIHNWCERGGIVGRGVLVDWLRWYENKRGTPPSPTARYEITCSDLDEVLKYQGTTTRLGDILLVRSGYVRWHNNSSPEERKRGTMETGKAIGLQSNEKTVRWLYDKHFAAVAGDTLAFEAWPPSIKSGWCLHEWLLVQWGTPIGELWDLEGLSTACEKAGRWTFFFTSAPLHVKGGVGSPPGAIAIL